MTLLVLCAAGVLAAGLAVAAPRTLSRLAGALLASSLLAAPALGGPTLDLQVLDAGSGPKRLLAVAPAAGSSQTVEVRTKMNMTMTMGEMVIPQDMPVMVMTMRTTVDSVAANGDISYHFELVGADVEAGPEAPPALIDAVRAEVGKMVGVKGRSVVSKFGETRDASYELPPGADPAMSEVYDRMETSMSTSLPTVAVGKGAKWRVKQVLEQQGMRIRQEATYELVSLTGDVAQLALTIRQSADPQVLQAEGMQGTANLLVFNTDGGGTVELDLGRVLPTRSVLDTSTEMKVTVEAQGQKMDVATSVETHVVLTQK